MRALLLMLVFVIHLTCGLGQKVSHYNQGATQTGAGRVLRVVSTIINPYLDHRKVDDSVPENENDVMTTASSTDNPGYENVTSQNSTEAPAQELPTPYEGFVPDLVGVLLPHLDEYDSYQLEVVSKTEDKSSYEIMLEYLEQKKADVAAGPMTVTLTKEKRADFTYPFLQFEATIVLDESLESRFSSLEDLVNQKEDDPDNRFIRYGVRRNGAIHKFLAQSEEPIHKKMMKYFNNNDYVLKLNDDDGIAGVRWVNYAYILEGSTADWVIGQKPCTLYGIKAGFFGRQYSLAVPNQSELRDKLNAAILEAKHEGAFGDIVQKWLKPNDCAAAAAWRVKLSIFSIMSSFFFVILVR